ncbi:MAG: hypothetical protein ACNA8W_14525 [Bradymonadaceae bacterium]
MLVLSNTPPVCGQSDANLINSYASMMMLDGATGTVVPAEQHRSMTYVFSYGHDALGRNRSRCMYHCWPNDGPGLYHDDFVRGVRGPLTYDSCEEVRRLDPAAPSGTYRVETDDVECVF